MIQMVSKFKEIQYCESNCCSNCKNYRYSCFYEKTFCELHKISDISETSICKDFKKKQ